MGAAEFPCAIYPPPKVASISDELLCVVAATGSQHRVRFFQGPGQCQGAASVCKEAIIEFEVGL